jgi:flagellar hook-basal body complex protein FliE
MTVIGTLQPSLPALTGGALRPAESGGADFGMLLADAARNAAQTLRAAETVSMDGLAGRATIQDVVEGVMAAERTFNASLAIRDKLVASWLDLSRMSV